MAYVLLELPVPRCLGRDQRQRGHQEVDFAEASSSHALKGLVGGRMRSEPMASKTGCALHAS